MIRTRTARRIAAAAAFGGGGVGVLTGAMFGLLYAEAKMARRTVGVPNGEAPRAEGRYGEYAGDPIRLVLIGDSTAAGLGVTDPQHTPGALLASGLADVARTPVQLVNVARSGAQSSDLERQVTIALAHEPDVAVIIIGANDVTHRMRPAESVRHLEQATRRLLASGCEVVVGTCPDLGTIEPIAQPLRYLARQWSRNLAAAQTIAVVEAGGRTVSLGALLGPEFEARPGDLFGPDRFHPSEEGYAHAAMAVLPSLCAALGLWPLDTERPDSFRGEGVLPIALAAIEAAEEGGTEVAGTAVAGSERGPRGRWALLRHRRRRRIAAPQPADGESAEAETTEAGAVEDALLPDPDTDGHAGPDDEAAGAAGRSAAPARTPARANDRVDDRADGQGAGDDPGAGEVPATEEDSEAPETPDDPDNPDNPATGATPARREDGGDPGAAAHHGRIDGRPHTATPASTHTSTHTATHAATDRRTDGGTGAGTGGGTGGGLDGRTGTEAGAETDGGATAAPGGDGVPGQSPAAGATGAHGGPVDERSSLI